MAPAVWSRFTADPRAIGAGELRASDSDRELTLSLLADAYADGRLDRAEYDARCDTALTLRRLGEVVPLVVDLVVPGAPRGRGASAREEAVELYRREVRDARNGFVMVSLVCLGVWGAVAIGTGSLQLFWPVFPIVGVGLGWVGALMGQHGRVDSLEEEILQQRRRRGELED